MKDAKIVPPYKDDEDLHEWQKWAEKTHATFIINDALSDKSAKEVLIN